MRQSTEIDLRHGRPKLACGQIEEADTKKNDNMAQEEL
jgi:hypothetical protein